MTTNMTKEIWIKSVPGHWDRVKKPVYIIGLGETDTEAGRRVITPFKSSLGKMLEQGKYIRVLGSKNELQFYRPGSMPSKYKMKLFEELKDGAKCWELKDPLSEEHYNLLLKVSITPNELTKELYHAS